MTSRHDERSLLRIIMVTVGLVTLAVVVEAAILYAYFIFVTIPSLEKRSKN